MTHDLLLKALHAEMGILAVGVAYITQIHRRPNQNPMGLSKTQSSQILRKVVDINLKDTRGNQNT